MSSGPFYQASGRRRMSPNPAQDDPLLNIIMPPPDETAQQRVARETSETQARALSEEIDRQLYKDRDAFTNKERIRILLLGQSESGKSTTLKNFQLFYSPQAFHAEHKAWRYVILLNLARSVRVILELVEEQFTLQDEYEASKSSATHVSSLVSPARSKSFSLCDDERAGVGSTSPSSSQLLSPMTGYRALLHSDTPSLAGSRQSQEHLHNRRSSIRSTNKNGNTVGETSEDKKDATKKKFKIDDLITGTIGKKRARSHSATLPNPLIRGKVKHTTSTCSTDSTVSSRKSIKGVSKTNSLTAITAPRIQMPVRPSNTLKLPPGPLLTSHHRLLKMKLAPLAAVESQLLCELSTPMEEGESRRPCPLGRLKDHKELIVRPLRGWEEKFGRLRIGTPRWLKEEPMARGPDDPSHIISACANDLIRLWKDSAIQELLAKNEIRLEYEPGFFLNDIDRVSKLDYEPTDDDILRARFNTNGVCEYKFQFRNANHCTRHCVIYDVGGARTQRAVWQSYFDDADAIIFLASLSAFDQTLVEDPTMNRMEDSVQLFRSVCSSRLLTRANIILFLNKIDLLEAKLKAGVWVKDYIKHYGHRDNTPEAVTRYFRQFFATIHKDATPPGTKRIFYSHVTSVTNPRFMQNILEILRDVVVRNNTECLLF